MRFQGGECALALCNERHCFVILCFRVIKEILDCPQDQLQEERKYARCHLLSFSLCSLSVFGIVEIVILMALFQGECGIMGPPGLPGHNGRKVDELLILFSAKVWPDFSIFFFFFKVPSY